MTAILTICDTCRYSTEERDRDGRSGGEWLLSAVEDRLAQGGEAISVRRQSCLMGCSGHCTVAIQAPGKITYVLGRFAPTTESAEALIAYAALYADSETGQVPFKQWPAGVKGHFVARIAPLPDDLFEIGTSDQNRHGGEVASSDDR